MRTKSIVLFALLIVVAAALYLWRLEGRGSNAVQGSAALPAPAATGGAVQADRQPPRSSAQASNPPVTSTITGLSAPALLLASSDWKNALAQIENMTSLPLSERLFYRAVVLEGCSSYKEAVARSEPELVAAVEEGTLKSLVAFVTGLMKDERQKEAMAYNAQRQIVNVCRGFANMAITAVEVEQTYADAAAAGDPKAQARMVNRRLADSAAANAGKAPKELEQLRSPGDKPLGFADPITAAERSVLVNALFSGDPIAIRTAGSVLSIGGDQQSFRFGPDELDIGARSDEVWALVACQFGFECGLRNMTVSAACAELGKCADDYATYLREFVFTPSEFQSIQAQAQAIADAIRRRDDSAFQLVSRPGYRRVLVEGPSRITIR